MHRIWVNGEEGAGIPANDPGFTRGLNAFDTLRTYGKTPFRLAAHLRRLIASAAAMEIPCPARTQIRAEIEAVVSTDVWIRYTLTAGGNRVLEVCSIKPAYIGRNMTVATVSMQPTAWLPGSVKHGSRAGWVLAARKHGVDEVIFVDQNGHLLEANRSNLFAVVGGTLWTPPTEHGALEGVTRQAMLDAASEANLPIQIAPLPRDTAFDELYLSSTLKELSPVVTLDGSPVGGGPIGAKLHRAFRALVARECAATPLRNA